MHAVDEIRARLGVVDEQGRQAWDEAAGYARRVASSYAEGPNVADTLEQMRLKLREVELATLRMKELRWMLLRVSEGKKVHVPDADERPCARCGRHDAVFPVRICARCSGLGMFG